MAKKVIRLTEADLANVIKKVITEQSEERNITRAVQKFLNKIMRAGLMEDGKTCLLYTSPSPRDRQKSRMPSSA